MNDQDTAHLVAFLHLGEFGARRCRALIALAERGEMTVTEAWHAVRAGRAPSCLAAAPDLAQRWCDESSRLEPDEILDRHRSFGVVVTVAGDPQHPGGHDDDPHVPPVLFWSGSPIDIVARSVAIVGTRRCTRYGLDLAHEFGIGLASAGVAVVSGLALGIDAAAHAGALAAPDGAAPVAVVACGLDRIYPRRNRELWRAVAQRGVIVSEYPLGAAPLAWRFPARNRIIAAMSDAVVVVESHERGGSLITARIAGERGVTVLAVPGSVRSPASLGCNELIADGCAPCLSVADVMVAVGLHAGRSGSPLTAVQSELGAAGDAVLSVLGWESATFETLAGRVDLTMGGLAVALCQLQDIGVIEERSGRFARRSGAYDPP